jgi:hypothetical protein
MFLDPLMKHHFLFGPRTYDHGIPMILLIIFVFSLTFVIVASSRSYRRKSITTFIILVGTAWILHPTNQFYLLQM